MEKLKLRRRRRKKKKKNAYRVIWYAILVAVRSNSFLSHLHFTYTLQTTKGMHFLRPIRWRSRGSKLKSFTVSFVYLATSDYRPKGREGIRYLIRGSENYPISIPFRPPFCACSNRRKLFDERIFSSARIGSLMRKCTIVWMPFRAITVFWTDYITTEL